MENRFDLDNRKFQNRVQLVDWPTGRIGEQVDEQQVDYNTLIGKQGQLVTMEHRELVN
jgi:hypothetical protein